MIELAQIIVYLRPQNPKTNVVLNRDDNKIWQYTLGLSPKLTDAPLEKVPDNCTISFIVPNAQGDASRETTPGFYSPCPRVFDLSLIPPENHHREVLCLAMTLSLNPE